MPTVNGFDRRLLKSPLNKKREVKVIMQDKQRQQKRKNGHNELLISYNDHSILNGCADNTLYSQRIYHFG